MTGNRFESLSERFIRETEEELNMQLSSDQDPYLAYIDLIDQLIERELQRDSIVSHNQPSAQPASAPSPDKACSVESPKQPE